MTTIDMFPAEKRSAVFSKDRAYRYRLEIVWEPMLPLVQFIGLNPSTADEVRDDNTIRKCKQFARNWQCGGIIMTNIFAFRSTDPNPMKRHESPIAHPDESAANNFNLLAAALECKLHVAAWGNHGTHLGRGESVAAFFREHERPLKCFRITKANQPEHPLYMPYTQPLIDYSPS